MPIYMLQAAYTSEAWKAFTEKPENRGEAVAAQLEKLGGRLISFYNCFGEYDALAICELPDDVTAAALAISICAPGHVKDFKTTKLLTATEAMEAMRKAGGAPLPKPGARR
ncbi:MAG TPA: GYD domain-containing protein [Dehalococcoidia bacterium]|nr:GYD domain-containing protein [Dehalococcoidia bacterium]